MVVLLLLILQVDILLLQVPHTITAQNAAGCISAAANVTIAAHLLLLLLRHCTVLILHVLLLPELLL